jgi:hypothetical protein
VLNQLVRYAPLLRELKDAGTLLEVGSGDEGISAYLRRPVLGLEIRFAATPGRWLVAVRGTATHLPFRDGSIETVLIMDTLEHIPEPLRARCVEEARRVARSRVIVGGPMGERARRTDAGLATFYERRGIDVPEWLREHLRERAPDVDSIAEALRAPGWEVRARGNENAWLHAALMRIETRRLFVRALGKVRQHAPGPAAAIARALRAGPFYSYLVEARRTAPSHAASMRATSGPQA